MTHHDVEGQQGLGVASHQSLIWFPVLVTSFYVWINFLCFEKCRGYVGVVEKGMLDVRVVLSCCKVVF